jgi:hypothetical protein
VERHGRPFEVRLRDPKGIEFGIKFDSGLLEPGQTINQEPADLTAPGKTIAELRKEDWTISEPVTVSGIEAEEMTRIRQYAEEDSRIPLVPFGYVNSTWLAFKARIRPSDEIRRVANARAGIGFAIFRDGHLVDMFLPTVF